MANDNPEKYQQSGGVHLQRLTKAQACAEGLDPSKPWIVLAITDQKTEQSAIMPADYAMKVSDAIRQLVTAKVDE